MVGAIYSFFHVFGSTKKTKNGPKGWGHMRDPRQNTLGFLAVSGYRTARQGGFERDAEWVAAGASTGKLQTN